MEMEVNNKLGILGLPLLILLIGCSSSGKVPIRYYVIDPVIQDTLSSSEAFSSEEKLSVHILDLHLPQYLERYQMALRSGENELTLSDSHQWGENLRKNLLRTLGSNLSSLLDTPEISTPIARSARKADVKIRLFIERFDQAESGLVILNARYQLSSFAKEPTTYIFRQEMMNASPGNYAGIVKKMTVLFNALSIDIARRLPHLDNAS
ncbi:MAG: putative lipoprotein YmbA [Flavobacterium sp.]|jgi:uncharacterized lipoprotein YmbA